MNSLDYVLSFAYNGIEMIVKSTFI